MDYRERITMEPGKRRGQPCVRGLRITVYDVFGYRASGMTYDEVPADFPVLEAAKTFSRVLPLQPNESASRLPRSR